jgi:hypothetical protein
MQAYSNPDRESNPYALPDVEVFHIPEAEFLLAERDSIMYEMIMDYVFGTTDMTTDDVEDALTDPEIATLWHNAAKDLKGWYYWYCFPGCLPDSDPFGPYESYKEALEASREE